MKKLARLTAALTLAVAMVLPFQSANAFWGGGYWDDGYGWGPYGRGWHGGYHGGWNRWGGGPWGYGYGYGHPGPWGGFYGGYGPGWGYGAWGGYGYYPPVAVPTAPAKAKEKSDE